MGLFEQIKDKVSPPVEEQLSTMNKELERLKETNEIMRRFGASLTPDQVEFYRGVIADERAEAIMMIQRKKQQEIETARKKAAADDLIAKSHLNKELVLYVSKDGTGRGKKTPFKKGLAITCPHCGKDDAFESFTAHLKVELVRLNQVGQKAPFGLFLIRMPNAPFACSGCKKSIHLTLLNVPEGDE